MGLRRSPETMTGARAVAECVRREGVGHAFCVPGESYLGVIDALYDSDVALIANRQEGGAAFAAEAYAKSSGGVGVCLVTRGPGAANATIGVHTARQDSTPLVLLVGQVERGHSGREAFQEVDLPALFAPITKWSVEVREAQRVPELVGRAFHVARSGRPGPVAVSLPADVLEETAEMRFADPLPAARPAAQPREARRLVEELSGAGRAVVIAGGGVVRSGAREEMVELSERLAVPVVSAFRRHDVFPNEHPNYLGHLGLGAAPEQRRAVEEAEVVLALGTRLSEVTTQGYSLLRPHQRLLHVDVDPEVFGMHRTPQLAVLSDAGEALRAMIEASGGLAPERPEERRAWVRERRRSYESFADPLGVQAEDGGYVDRARMVEAAMELLPEDSVVTVDAGNFAGWVHRFYKFGDSSGFVGPTSGAMGYGMPAALGAKLAQPHRTVLSFSGDGGFMMTVGELETAVRYGVPYVSVVVNNGMYGTIRAHQEREFPGRVHATALTNPDFSEIACQFGAHGERVQRTADFAPALERALAAKAPAVVEVLADPERLTPTSTVESLRAMEGKE